MLESEYLNNLKKMTIDSDLTQFCKCRNFHPDENFMTDYNLMLKNDIFNQIVNVGLESGKRIKKSNIDIFRLVHWSGINL